jgi:Holliday junction DNA helicase RuvA
LILELKGKLSDISHSHAYKGHQPAWREQLSSALVSLGFSPKESDSAISNVIASLQSDGLEASTLDLSELLKLTLASGKSSRG